MVQTEKTRINVETAKLIWNIAKKSPEHGNAVMDVLGEEIYTHVMRLQSTPEDEIIDKS